MCDRKTKGGKAKVKEVRYRDYLDKIWQWNFIYST